MFVRLALEEDIPTIVELARLNCEISTPHLTYSPEKVVQTCRDYLDTANPTIFVVEKERQVIGLLAATINEYRHADGLFTTQEIIFVHPAFQGSRAALLLMNELIRWSKMLGAIEITGGNDNSYKSERTAKFLKHFGFEQVGFFMRRMMENG
jgi:L-amino acid N-acyltransferase YncA